MARLDAISDVFGELAGALARTEAVVADNDDNGEGGQRRLPRLGTLGQQQSQWPSRDVFTPSAHASSPDVKVDELRANLQVENSEEEEEEAQTRSESSGEGSSGSPSGPRWAWRTVEDYQEQHGKLK